MNDLMNQKTYKSNLMKRRYRWERPLYFAK